MFIFRLGITLTMFDMNSAQQFDHLLQNPHSTFWCHFFVLIGPCDFDQITISVIMCFLVCCDIFSSTIVCGVFCAVSLLHFGCFIFTFTLDSYYNTQHNYLLNSYRQYKTSIFIENSCSIQHQSLSRIIVTSIAAT